MSGLVGTFKMLLGVDCSVYGAAGEGVWGWLLPVLPALRWEDLVDWGSP